MLDGRGGADLLSGQGGTDTVLYAGRTAPVHVDLTQLTIGTEGEEGEGDTVTADVERVTGGAGGDTLNGSDADNLLDGGAGNDSITGARGADDLRGGCRPRLPARPRRPRRPPRLRRRHRHRGGRGADTVSACEFGTPSGGGVNPRTTPKPPADLSVPFSFVFGSLDLPTEPVTLRHGHVSLTVSCPVATPGGRCTGVITLVPAGPKAKAKAKRSRRTRRFRNSIGDKAYAIRAGKKAKVRVRISRVGRRAITRTGSARVHVYLRRTKRATHAKRVAGALKVQASRRTKRQRRPPRSA